MWNSSRQIRPPIYSLKQSKLRRRRVIRYAILYFTILIVFVALLAGPTVGGKYISKDTLNDLDSKMPIEGLFQPNNGDLMNNTKNRTETGTGAPGYSGVALKTMTKSAADSEATDDSSSNEKRGFRFV